MSKKNIIIIVGVVLIVLAVIGGGFFMLWQKLSTLDKPQGEESGRSSEKSTHGGMGLVFALDSFIVNLSDQGGKLRTESI